MAKASIFILGLFFARSIFGQSSNEPNFSPKPYLDDYLALRDHISRSYANLEYLLTYYTIDPYALNEKTIHALQTSKNDEEAVNALKEFAKSFKDGHFRLLDPKAPTKDENQQVTVNASTPPALACQAINGTINKSFEFPFPIEGVKILKRGGSEFPFLIAERNKSKIGIIRISSFQTEAYPQICLDAWAKYAKNLKGRCDKKCKDDFRYKVMRRALVDKFYISLNKVRAHKPQSLIIDLTQNGGGTDWVKDVTALLTKQKILCGQRGFIKSPHYTQIFTDELNTLRKDPKKNADDIKRMETQLRLASETCDRSPIWTQKNFKLPCSLVGYHEEDKCKYDELKFPGKSKYTGKLFFLVDKRTGSAAEDIVARHMDSKSATIVGDHTAGSGCGYVNGGIEFSLPNSKLMVKVPDCIRERVDGTNEVVGIEPQIKLDMSKISDPKFLTHLLDRIAE